MLEFDDIQHILLTRAPALTGRYEFLSFRDAAGGRAWLSAIWRQVQSAAAMRASVERDKRWVTVAFTWNGLRALGVDEASLATFPEEFRQGMVARAETLGDTGRECTPTIGSADSPARTSTRSPSCSPAMPRNGAVPCGARKTRRAMRRRRGALGARLGGDAAVRLRARSFRLSRPALAAGHRRQRRGADAGLRRAAQAGRVHPRLSRTKTACPPTCRSPRFSPATAATWPIAGLQEHVGRFRDFLRAARRDAGGAGTDRGETDGPLAQRRAARAGARQGRSRARRRSAAKQRLQLQGDGPAWICGSARLAHAADESSRHGART